MHKKERDAHECVRASSSVSFLPSPKYFLYARDMCVSLFVRREADSIGFPDREREDGEPGAGGSEEEGRGGGPEGIAPAEAAAAVPLCM